MPQIHLTTFIEAPIERVFDLSRSIDLHKHSMAKHKEEPIGALINGLVKEADEITWKARHLFKTRVLKTKIAAFDKPNSFTDEQVSGDFSSMKHQHFFKPVENGTIMIDVFSFKTPYGFIGKILNKLYLSNYMKRLLEERNKQIKEIAEGNRWKNYISN
jgi:ligand-binding SRPBCC domain-containing protein